MKNYGMWSYDEKNDNIKPCPYNCTKKHEHYVGSFTAAMKYFVGDLSNAKEGKGDLFNIIVTHQTNDRFNFKTSAELYEILMYNASTPKYWIPEDKREETVMKLIKKASGMHLIDDERIYLYLTNKEKLTDSENRRLYKMKKFAGR